MTQRVLFVRAVNVGGTARLPMAEFRALLERLGAQRVRTYIASGNAVIDVPEKWGHSDVATFDATVEHELESTFGFRREIMSRSVAELQAIVAAHPFDTSNPQFSYVMFLNAIPERDRVAGAAEIATGADEWALRGSQLHLRYPEGMSKATLKSDALLKRLGVMGTARNLRTVQAIIDLAHR